MSKASATAASAAAAVVNNHAQDDDDEDEHLFFDANGNPIDEQDETNLLMALDMQIMMQKQQQQQRHQGGGGGAQQQQQDDDDLDEDAFVQFRSTSVAPGVTSSPVSPSSPLDYSSLFKKLDERTARAAAAAATNNNNATELLDEDDRKLFEEFENETKRLAAEMAEYERQQQQEEEEDEEDEDDDRTQEASGSGSAGEMSAGSTSTGGKEQYADDEGMRESIASREFSMTREQTDESQWKLEKILARKTVPVVANEDEQDDADYYEDNDTRAAVGSSMMVRRKQRREHCYQCRFAEGRGVFWVLRSDLIADGAGKQCDEFDVKVREHAKTERSKRTHFKGPCPYPSVAGVFEALGGKKPAKRKLVAGPSPAVMKPHQKFFDDMFPDIEATVRKNFSKQSYRALRIINIAPAEPSQRFIQTMRSDNFSPRHLWLLCHGSPAVDGIMSKGLLVPGSGGVRIANGQMYSRDVNSIYTANLESAVGTSVCYCRGVTDMFICVGMVQNESSQCHNNNNILTFPDADYVVPVWLVKWESGGGNVADTSKPVRFFNFNEFRNMHVPGEGQTAMMSEAQQQKQKDDAALAGLTASQRKKVLRIRRRALAYATGQ